MGSMIQQDTKGCISCGICLEICPNYCFRQEEENILLQYPQTCCSCGHCIALCPEEVLSHRDVPHEHFKPSEQTSINPEQMAQLLSSRRSIRHYRDRQLSDEELSSLLQAARLAGTSSNGQTEGFMVLQNRERIRSLELLVIKTLWNAGLKYLKGGFMKKLLERKYGGEMIQQYSDYFGIIQNRRKHGEEEGMIFRNAPTIVVVYGLKANFLAQTNAALAVRNMELLAGTMGLGSCWVGFLPSAAAKSRKIDRFLNIPKGYTVLGALMLGEAVHSYPAQPPRKSRSVIWDR